MVDDDGSHDKYDDDERWWSCLPGIHARVKNGVATEALAAIDRNNAVVKAAQLTHMHTDGLPRPGKTFPDLLYLSIQTRVI